MKGGAYGLTNSFRLVNAVTNVNRRDVRERSILLFRTSPALVTKRNVLRRTTLFHLHVSFLLRIRSPEFVFILELQATIVPLSRTAWRNSERLMSLLLHGCLISCSVAETKDRFNYSVPESVAYRGGLRRRYTIAMYTDIQDLSGILGVRYEVTQIQVSRRLYGCYVNVTLSKHEFSKMFFFFDVKIFSIQ